MYLRQAIVFALSIVLAVGFAGAYEFHMEGDDSGGTVGPDPSPSGPSACEDGIDNDGDGYADGADTTHEIEDGVERGDPGCSKPYENDDTEANVYDLDASWIFGNYRSAPTSEDSTVYYGSEVIENGSTIEIFPDEITGDNEINETYVEDAHNWAGGELQWSLIEAQEDRHEGTMDGSTTDEVEGSGELIDAPQNDTSDGDGSQCGDAIRGNDENNFDCPEDYGLPDDRPEDEDGTKSESEDTVTDILNDKVSQWDANNADGVSIGDDNNDANNGDYLGSKSNNDDTDDNIEYRFDNSGQGLVAPEAQGSKTDDISGSDPYTDDLQSGTQSSAGESDDQVVQDQEWEDVPDFYLEDSDGDGNPDEIWMVYPEKTGETKIGSVTDYDLTGKKEVESWSKDGSSVSQCSGTNCSDSGSKKCTSIDDSEDTKYTLKSEDTKTVSTTENEEYYASSSGDYGHSKESTNLPELSVEVTRHPGYETEQVDDHSCDGKTQPETCEGSGGCSSDPSIDTYGEDSSQTIATGQTSNEITYRFEDLELKSEKVFDLNPDENPSYSPSNPMDALFEGDTFKYGDDSYDINNIHYNAHDGRAYFSYKVDTDDNMMGNDEAISSSRFTLEVDGNDFRSVRNWYRTWDVDGPQGQSDGFMALLHRKGSLGDGEIELQGASNRFMSTSTEGSEAFDIVQSGDALGHITANTDGCDDPFSHCVAAVDVSFKNLDQWDDPTDPSYQEGDQSYPSAVTFEENIQDTNQSMGVCEMYQELYPDSKLNSRYKTDSDSPTEPRDSYCAGDVPNEFWAAMEGPEVDESEVETHHLEASVDAITDCVWYGEDVDEGTVRNVGHESFPDYEEGGYSPDMEVCLAIDSSGESFDQDGETYHETSPSDDPGDFVDIDNYDWDQDGSIEEVGGEWYDLDNERVNEYLRAGGNGHDLIENGDPNDESQVAYYWRRNYNPQHDDYNPEGGEVGIPLEDNCGPLVEGCDDSEDQTAGKTPVFFSFFWESVGYT